MLPYHFFKQIFMANPVGHSQVRILTLLEQFINPYIVFLKKFNNCNTEPVPRVKGGEASGLASVNV